MSACFALTLGTPIGITGVDARTSEEDLGRWIAEGEKAAAEHINDKSIARPKSAVMLMIAGVRTWHAASGSHDRRKARRPLRLCVQPPAV